MLVPPSDPPAIVQPAPHHHHKLIHWSCKQLRHFWVDNGGPRKAEDEAAAVAFAESDGYRYATHHNGPGSIDRGLWQINSEYWPEGSHYRPTLNVKAAIKIHGLDGWTAWSSVAAGHEHGECGFK